MKPLIITLQILVCKYLCTSLITREITTKVPTLLGPQKGKFMTKTNWWTVAESYPIIQAATTKNMHILGSIIVR